MKALDSLGYRQALTFIDGESDLPTAIAAAQQGHRNYAKRQLTWFRREPGVHWIPAFGNEPQTRATAGLFVESALNARRCEPEA